MNEFDKWWQGHTKHWMKSTAFEVEDVGKAAFLAGAAAMREKAAEVADNRDMFLGDRCDRLAKEIAAAIEKIEVE